MFARALLAAALLPGCADPPAAVAACPGAQPAAGAGAIAPGLLAEASGLVESGAQPGVFWVVEDSGGGRRIHAFDGASGALAGRLEVQVGAAFTDAEDLGRSGAPGAPGTLWVADTGDNERARSAVRLVAVAEPAGPVAGEQAVDARVLTVTLEGGPADIEALLVDPGGAEAVLVGKSKGQAPLWRVPLDAGDTVDAPRVGSVAVEALGRKPSGGAVSPDGTRVALRSEDAILLWERDPAQPLAEALAGAPCLLPAPDEPNGEALAFAGRGLWSLSEGDAPSFFEIAVE
jgi:hypothetical protein